MIWWRIRFNGGHTFGYQVMTPELDRLIGIFDDAGNRVADPYDYTTIDSGPEAHIGVTPPPWADQINA